VRICWVFICELEKMGLAADFAEAFAAFGLAIQRDAKRTCWRSRRQDAGGVPAESRLRDNLKANQEREVQSGG